MVALQTQLRPQEILLEPILSGTHETVRTGRENYIAQLKSNTLPIPGKGAWRNSNLLTLLKAAIETPQASESSIKSHSIREASLDTLLDSEFLADFNTSTTKDLQTLVNLNGALHQHGRLFETPTEVNMNSSLIIEESKPSIERFHIKVSEGSSLDFSETFNQGNRVVLCDIAPYGKMDAELNFNPGDGVGFHHLAIRLAEGAQLNLNLASRGAKLLRNEMVVLLEGQGSEITLTGGWRLNRQNHLDTLIQIHHRVGQTQSSQKFHGVVDDRARSSFSGLIKIDRDAAASEAHLQNRNISLSPTARAHTQPELEIYTDDVICSHGATTGQLDENVLMYMRSRGIGLPAAKDLLISGFLREVTSDVKTEALLA